MTSFYDDLETRSADQRAADWSANLERIVRHASEQPGYANSFKDIGTHKRVSFMALFALVFLFGFTSIDPPKIFLACFAIYAISGPSFGLWRRLRKREKAVLSRA